MGAVLFFVLIGLAFGALFITTKRFVVNTSKNLILLVLTSSLGCCGLIAVTLTALPYATWFVLWCQFQCANLPLSLSNLTWFLPWIIILSLFVFPIFALIGIVTPALLDVVGRRYEDSFFGIKAPGSVLVLSTIGSIVGVLVTSVSVIPNDIFYSGIETVFIICGIIFLVIFYLYFDSKKKVFGLAHTVLVCCFIVPFIDRDVDTPQLESYFTVSWGIFFGCECNSISELQKNSRSLY